MKSLVVSKTKILMGSPFVIETMKKTILSFVFLISFFVLLSLVYQNSYPLYDGINVYGTSQSASTLSPSGANSISSTFGPDIQKLISQIALKLSDANPSVSYTSLVKVIENLALQTHNKNGDVKASLMQMLDQVSKDSKNSNVAKSIIALALKETSDNNMESVPLNAQPQESSGDLDDQNQSIRSLYDEGFDLFVSGDYREASKYFEQILEIDPTNKDALYMKPNSLFYLGEYQQALIYFDKLLEVYPDDLETLVTKSHTLINLGREAEAISNLDRVIELDPESFEASEAMSVKELLREGTYFNY
ncbi:MAG: tetratricopeptide repeat protein [Candidatus Nitrosocosmicus sp.]